MHQKETRCAAGLVDHLPDCTHEKHAALIQALSHKFSYESKKHMIATGPGLILITLVVLKITQSPKPVLYGQIMVLLSPLSLRFHVDGDKLVPYVVIMDMNMLVY